MLEKAYGAHPDGDPFALADEQAALTTPLGRMEARALEEQRIAAGGLPRLPILPTPTRITPSTHLESSVERNGQSITMITLDDSDEEEKAPALNRILSGMVLPMLPKESTPFSGEHGSGMEEDSHGFSTADEGEPETGEMTEGVEEDNEADTVMNEENSEESEESEDDENEVSINLGGEEDSTVKEIKRVPSLSTGLAGPSPLGLTSFRPEDPLPPLPTTSNPSDIPASSETTVTAKAAPTRPPRFRSPTPPPRVYIQPPTIRLIINLPPSNMELDSPWYSVADLAKEAGYDSIEEEEVGGSASDGSGSEDDPMDGGEKQVKGKGKAVVPLEAPVVEARTATGEIIPAATLALTPAVPPPKKRQRKFVGRNDGYDVEDPFVDDSELALFEPKYYHRPKQDGFFVCNGILELISDTQPVGRGGRAAGSKNKPRYDADGKLLPQPRKPSASTPAPTSKGKKSATPMNLDEEGSSASSIPAFGGMPAPVKKKAHVGFSPVMLEQLQMLKQEAAKESFEPKNKFPPRLKTLLTAVAARAYGMKEYDDNFFAVLPTIFPYNLFTLKKLVKREFFAQHTALIEEDQAEIIVKMKKAIEELLPAQIIEFDAIHKEWEEKVLAAKTAKILAEGGDPSSLAGVAMENLGSLGPEGVVVLEFPDLIEPKRKFRFGEEFRELVYEIIILEDTKIELAATKLELDKSDSKVPSQLSGRKAIYADLCKLWPAEWMTTNFLSREVSAAKKKKDKELAKAAAI